ncbi:RND family efflux transporter, MFP subunit [Paraburkholderia lycopersici]|uniref:RND family efflux transporter, MFP subunit n=2 Tax=Paraburkholderia lycopersici TaxID=416944 RepID=A0A1G7A3Y2_9BURK|nr:RND family efflux transporter, MFP subunit [Paraburkholderia lycopersici]
MFLALAIFIAWRLCSYYMLAPWTRDGHIYADTVRLSADVPGIITAVYVTDNQPVKRGQPLFVIDQSRYDLARQQAEAEVQRRLVATDQARREYMRNVGLGDLVSQEALEESRERLQSDESDLVYSRTLLNVANLNVGRTVVTSPVDGYVNDKAPHVGEYVERGSPIVSVVDASSFSAVRYFEETKLNGIRLGQSADIYVVGEQVPLHGRVKSIAAAVEDRERTESPNLLPNIDPNFAWVRLEQRIPVRVTLDGTPDNLRLVAGRTATVFINEAPNSGAIQWRLRGSSRPSWSWFLFSL